MTNGTRGWPAALVSVSYVARTLTNEHPHLTYPATLTAVTSYLTQAGWGPPDTLTAASLISVDMAEQVRNHIKETGGS